MILGLIALFLYISYRKGKFDVSGFIYALVFWCLFLYAITELLSVGSLLNVVSLWIVWMMLDTVLIVLLIKNKAFKLLKESLHFDSRDSKYKFICAGLFILFALVIMYISSHVVPYNWDSLTYHLTRIFIWRQNQSVAHFATVGWRQVASPVLAEFVNTNVYIMFYPLFKANDGLFNILQSVSYLINIGFVYAISVKIGCKKRFGLFAAFLFACAPICFAEAMSTQVDQFATVWLLGFIYVVLEMIYDREKVNLNADGRIRMAVLGISAGFGYLAKPSVLIGMMIFAIWLIVVCFRRKDDTKLIVQWIVMTCLTAVLVMAPEIIRNLLTFHALSHKQVGAQQLVGTLDPRYLLVNCLKNTTFNLPYMYWPWLNSILSAIVYGTAAFLGINADALSISESGTPIVYHTEPDFGFDTAVNPLIVSLLIFVCICYVIRLICNRKHNYKGLSYSKIAVISFLTICILVRWEEYVTRYMISYLAILCPMIAFEIQKLSFNKPVRALQCILLAVVSLVGARDLYDELYCYHSQAYFGTDTVEHDRHHFAKRELYDSYAEIKEFVEQNGYQNIGLNMSDGSAEYPLLVMLTENNEDIVFEQVNVDNMTEVYEDMSFTPDCIIVFADEPVTDNNYGFNNISYSESNWITDKIVIYYKQ